MRGGDIIRRARPEWAVQPIDPIRLSRGSMNAEREPQGDVDASYSGDKIASGQPISAPFQFGGHRWVCVGSGPAEWECYRLKHPSEVAEARTYAQNSDLEDEARYRPTGWYDGMLVRVGKGQMVLVGPPAIFVPGERQQMDLFA